NFLQGQYVRPLQVLALNTEEGWVEDVSQLIARKVRAVAQRERQELTDGTRAFIDAHTEAAANVGPRSSETISNFQNPKDCLRGARLPHAANRDASFRPPRQRARAA